MLGRIPERSKGPLPLVRIGVRDKLRCICRLRLLLWVTVMVDMAFKEKLSS
jgi:hypothetical protein